jgi:hypothetical protein
MNAIGAERVAEAIGINAGVHVPAGIPHRSLGLADRGIDRASTITAGETDEDRRGDPQGPH